LIGIQAIMQAENSKIKSKEIDKHSWKSKNSAANRAQRAVRAERNINKFIFS